MAEIVVGLGANLGDAPQALHAAAEALGRAVAVRRGSHLYQSAPMYRLDQPMFWNAALVVETQIGPLPLLRLLKDIERGLGRISRDANGPREIDLDIVSYGCVEYGYFESGRELLRIPHPRAFERRFVLAPVHEIAPDAILPGFGRVADLILATNDQAESVLRHGDAVLPISSER